MKTIIELQELIAQNKVNSRYEELETFVSTHLIKVPDDTEGWIKLRDKYKILPDSEYEKHLKEARQGQYDFNRAVIEMGTINILRHESYPKELRTIMAEIYQIDTVELVEQVTEKGNADITIFNLLDAYKPLFEKMVIEWFKGKIIHFVLRVNSEPTNELHQSIIQAQFKAESELLINSKNPVLPFYHERLTALMVNLDKRRTIAGGFKIKHPKKQPVIINPDLRLADVLLEGIPVDEVKKLFKNKEYSCQYLGMFLRYLKKMRYFKRKIHEEEIEILGRNEFDQEFNDHRKYNVANLNAANDFRFRDIPEPKSLIKS